MDAAGGSNFLLVGSQQLFSVPYAMYAAESGTGLQAGEGIDLSDKTVTNTAPTKSAERSSTDAGMLPGPIVQATGMAARGARSTSSVVFMG